MLPEKPIAENLKDAMELLQWYRDKIDSKKFSRVLPRIIAS